MTGKTKKVLVTGATGYIGGRLVPRLLERDYHVRCLARHPEHLEGRNWPGVQIVKGDAMDPQSLEAAMNGTEAAFYLIHSMALKSPDYVARDAHAAGNFAKAAAATGIRRIIYLGGLGDPGSGLSRHLMSRHKVGEILRKAGPSVTEFRAAVIVGSGSVSFEMIRYLVERLPVIPSFAWLKNRCQPIAIRDVLNYLVSSLEVSQSSDRILEIGGSSILTYEEMMRVYAGLRNLKRYFMPVPFRIPRHCAWLAGILTPIPTYYALPLIESLQNEVICKDSSALDMFDISPLDYDTAVRYALRKIREDAVETSWTMSLFPRHEALYSLRSNKGLICDERMLEVSAPAEKVFSVYSGIGGNRGWFFMDFMWNSRAIIDWILGGVGMRRGRRHKNVINQGEPLDFWRVERVVPGRLMLLRAEMKLPGKAWLQFESIAKDRKNSLIRQTAYFEPKGFWGNLYWYVLYPIHGTIFAGLIKEIKRRAEK